MRTRSVPEKVLPEGPKFYHPAIYDIFSAASSRTYPSLCLHPYTHESLDRTLLTSNDAEREKNDAKGDNIYSTGRKLVSYNAAAISCGVPSCLWCYICIRRGYVNVQGKIVSWISGKKKTDFLVPGVTLAPVIWYVRTRCMLYPCMVLPMDGVT